MSRTRKILALLAVASLALAYAAGYSVGQLKPADESKSISAEALRSLDESAKGRPPDRACSPGAMMGNCP